MKLEELAAHEEIRQLAYRYALAIDSRDLDSLVGLFVDDVRVGATETGRDALRAFFDQSLREVGVTILHVGNHLIDLDGPDRATGTVYCRGEVEVGGQWVVQAILYEDVYERRDGRGRRAEQAGQAGESRWYFVRRRHRLWYGADVLERPLGLPPANWPEHHTGKGDLPEAWDTWQAFWDSGG